MIGVGAGVSYLRDNGPAPTGGGQAGGGPTGPGSGPSVTALPVTATARWHAAASTVSADAGRVTAASDLQGLAAAVAGGPGIGPLALTDALGQPFWRFEGDEYLTIAQDLVLSARDMTVFMVGRFHRISNKCPVFSLGAEAFGNGANTVRPVLEASSISQGAPILRGFARPSNGLDPGAEWMVPGSQMQVAGVTGRANADGGTQIWINEHSLSTVQPYNTVGVAGAEIGRYARSPGASGSWGTFDLYEMVVIDRQVTAAEGDAITAALMAGYSIPSVAHQLVLEGDSIMQGTGDVTSGLAAGMIVSAPGTGRLGADWRVINMGTSGNQIGNLLTRRDLADGWAAQTLPGSARNVMAFELGRNDFGVGSQTGASHYVNMVDYIAHVTDGVLARGWEVRLMANIASGASLQPNIEAFRTLIRDPQFSVDTDTDASGAYAGQLSVIDTDLITDRGGTVFFDTGDASDQTYYAGDSTHPNITGAILRLTGGDDPNRAVFAGL